ncbi:hypothetical protein [Nonomuraea sp. NPDC023979]|uniref:hypothetical protein n=1 Tax=Nonomuraea sp. NPDC023979 TaxID=3154796 RepID=UPI0033FC8251
MTISQVVFNCDTPRCLTHVKVAAPDVESAVRLAGEQFGWSQRDGKDLCDLCTRVPACCRCSPVICRSDDTGDHCATAGCAYCMNGCPAADDVPCCKEAPAVGNPAEQNGADLLLDHIQQCHPQVEALVASQSGPVDVAELERAGWTVERTEYVAGKRVRIMRAPDTRATREENPDD